MPELVSLELDVNLALSDSDPRLKLHTRVRRLSVHPSVQIVIVLKLTESLISPPAPLFSLFMPLANLSTLVPRALYASECLPFGLGFLPSFLECSTVSSSFERLLSQAPLCAVALTAQSHPVGRRQAPPGV